ncbi:ABC transporter ATP-binding protein/permease [Aliarcobacter cryaerophilus]|uniref:ABC transporter ATP-binding protein/permease n=1 Tax=Aliarcobacter cryaerophilus TaxID=28198 RepID=UPI0008265DAD|nr:ABC transporter ATP-binding protein [Aliarcobacter cryaerophilus]
MINKKNVSIYNKINFLLDKKDKKIILLLILFSLIVAIIETLGIALIMPFIDVASNFDIINSNKYYNYIYINLKFESKVIFVLNFGIILIVFYIIRAKLNLLYYYLISKFSKNQIRIQSNKLFKNYLNMGYLEFINQNSSNLMKNIITETQYFPLVISSFIFIISELFIIILIYSVMLYIDWIVTISITLFLILNSLFLILTVSKSIKKQGKKREELQKNLYNITSSSFSNFKILKLQSNNDILTDEFGVNSLKFTRTAVINETLSHFPRIFLETIGFVLVIGIVIYLVSNNQTDVSNVLGIITMFVLGLYRLLPSVNRILSSYNQIMYYHKSIDAIYDDLIINTENLEDKRIEYNYSINLKSVNFKYSNKKNIFKDITLTINKGDKIAFIGPSGAGKSTLVDIIIGLCRPSSGEIYIDNTILNENNLKSWRKKIGYIPQQVYLFDGTVSQNVSFGKEFDENKIRDVLKKAKILDFLESHQDGINTFVGEGGIKLSGGQKQRIAIARALYQEPEVLVLDEATSALDEEIEKEIMDEIYEISQDKTLIIIAHRLSTINRCRKVYKLENKRLFIQ